MKLKSILTAAVLLSVVSLGSSVSAAASNTKTIDVTMERPFVRQVSNVVYEQVPSRGFTNVPMRMDLLIPQTKEAKPAVIYVTGGGFINSNKDNAIQERMTLAEQGFVVGSIEYRVAPTAQFPEPLEDVKAAVRFLRANAARFGVNPKKIGLMGGSAGGYLVSIAGTTNGTKQFDKGENLNYSSDVQAVVETFGVTDLTCIGSDFPPEVQKLHESPSATESLWINGPSVFVGRDGNVTSNPERLKAAQPATYISSKTPPFLIMHGTKDTVVSPSQADILYNALQEKGIKADIYKVTGAAHGGPFWVQPAVMDKIIEFFNDNLKK